VAGEHKKRAPAEERPPRRRRSSKNRAGALSIAGFAPDYYHHGGLRLGQRAGNAAFTCDFHDLSAVPADKPLGD
jgi:hypothetical protein